MSERHTVTPRTMCFIFHGQEVLLMKASDKKAYPGIYNALGGHVEKGEGIIACANREIQEESGLNAKNTRIRGILHVTNFFGKNLLLFVTSSNVPDKVTPPPHEEEVSEWIPMSQLDTVPLFEDLRPILETLTGLKEGQLFTGTSSFDDHGKLIQLDLRIS